MKAAGAWIGFVVAIVGIVIAFRIDISAARFFRSDVVVRDAFGQVSEPPYYDPAPYSLWLPSDWFVWDSIRSGHLPLWDRLQGGGYSPVLTVQNGVFHPLRWLVAVAPRELAPSVLIILAISASFLGMWLLLRDELRMSPASAALGAILFTFSSALLSNLHFSGDLLPLVHIPWIAFFQRRAARTKSIASICGLIVSIAFLLLAGHPLFAVTAGVVALGFACADAFAMRSPWPLLLLSAAAVCAVAVDAFAFVPPIVSLPDLWLYKTETRQGSVYALFDPFERWLRAIASMIVDRRSPSSLFDDTEFWLYVGVPALVLAGVGVVDALQRTRDRVVSGVLLLFFMLAVPGPWMAEIAATKPLTYMNRWYFAGGMAFAGACLAAGGFDFLWRRGLLARSIAGVCAIAAVTVYLARAYEVLQPRGWEEVVRGDVVAFLRADRGHRIIGTLGQTHLPNSSRITGVEDVRESTPIWSVRKHLWWEAVDPKVRRSTFPTFRMTERLDSPLIGDFNVANVVRSRLPTSGFRNGRGSARPAVEVLPWNGVVRPRAHFAERVVEVRSMEAAARLLREDRSVSASAAVAECSPVSVGRRCPQRPRAGEDTGAPPSVGYPSDSRVILEVESPSGGLVVLHDAYDKGWRARLDGRPVEILPVNLISRGVVVGPGRHRIEMVYEPPAFCIGAGISAAAILSMGITAVTVRRRRRLFGATRGGITSSRAALRGYRA